MCKLCVSSCLHRTTTRGHQVDTNWTPSGDQVIQHSVLTPLWQGCAWEFVGVHGLACIIGIALCRTDIFLCLTDTAALCQVCITHLACHTDIAHLYMRSCYCHGSLHKQDVLAFLAPACHKWRAEPLPPRPTPNRMHVFMVALSHCACRIDIGCMVENVGELWRTVTNCVEL